MHRLTSALNALAVASIFVACSRVTQTEVMKTQSPIAAAEKRNANAQYRLGITYEQGVGVPSDDAIAARLYEMAAKQHFAAAENALGQLYEIGRGVPKNLASAFMYYSLSARHGNVLGKYNLGRAYALGFATGTQQIHAALIPMRRTTPMPPFSPTSGGDELHHLNREDPSRACQIWEDPATKGLPLAEKALADCYRDGIGFQRDLKKAQRWYTAAAHATGAVASEARSELAKLPK